LHVVEPRQMAAPCGLLWQLVMRCIAGRLHAPRQAPVHPLDVVVMLSVKQRYSLLNCRQQSYSFWWLQTNLLLMYRRQITPWCTKAGYPFLEVSELVILFLMYRSWLFLLDVSNDAQLGKVASFIQISALQPALPLVSWHIW